MDRLISVAIFRPIAVVAAVLMVVMFGLVSLQTIPIQLTPEVNRPIINVTTRWPGAAPAEVEREIINRQEEVFRGLEGLETITGRAETGLGRLKLEFGVGQDMVVALLMVSNRLDRVGSYPAEVQEPTLDTSGDEDNAIAWLVLRHDKDAEQPSTSPIHGFFDLLDQVVTDRLQRVPGVADVRIYGGTAREMQVEVDPERLAQYHLTVPELLDALRAANASVSAGAVDEGKRRYVLRTEGDFTTLDAVRKVVLRSDSNGSDERVSHVTVADVATVKYGFKQPVSKIRMLGEPALGLPVYRENGANVIEVMKGVRRTVAEVNEQVLKPRGMVLLQVYDETDYIDSAVELVTQNIYIGGTLAALILLLFLRSGGATLVVSVAVPVSIIGSFVAMAALGRSINVVSLAGFAFAVGLVVDSAILVLENIYRLRQRGMDPADAAYTGTSQVWGAILVSALTTVMVFIPILVMDLEVGQLFRDIAVAISVAVMLSLLVAITLIPALARRMLAGITASPPIRLPGIDHAASAIHRFLEGFARSVVASRPKAGCVIAAVTLTCGLATWLLLPRLDYLPQGNRNLVFGFLLPPPGYNLTTMIDIAGKVESTTRELWSPSIGAGPDTGGRTTQASDGRPLIDRFFFAAFRANSIIAATAVEPRRVGELIPILHKSLLSEPGTFGFFRQTSLFGRGNVRTVDLDISGGTFQEIVEVAQRAFGKVSATLPPSGGTQIRPRPALSLGAPEIRVHPDLVRLKDNGMTARDLGITLDAFNDGVRVAEITVDGRLMDLTLKGPDTHLRTTQGVNDLPVVTRDGMIVPASTLASIEVTTGPTEIRHREHVRTVTLQISPPPDMPLEVAMDRVRTDVIQALQKEGIPPSTQLVLSGTADALTETWDEMTIDLLMALMIVYLVMAVLFESFFYPLIIIFSVPLATAGGVLGLVLLAQFQVQNLDMLTLLGFVILIGIVVNNAILLVHQTLFHLRTEGMEPGAAIIEATRNRIRPIFMSTMTSVLGMMPLVLFPGAGSELYRGLGSVVIGGLSLSAILTLLVIPSLLSLTLVPIERRSMRSQRLMSTATPATSDAD